MCGQISLACTGECKWAIAEFKDGTKAEICGLTKGQYTKGLATRAEQGQNVLYERKYGDGRSFVSKKKDRGTLVCIFKESFGKEKSQICQMAVKVYGDDDEVVGRKNGGGSLYVGSLLSLQRLLACGGACGFEPLVLLNRVRSNTEKPTRPTSPRPAGGDCSTISCEKSPNGLLSLGPGCRS